MALRHRRVVILGILALFLAVGGGPSLGPQTLAHADDSKAAFFPLGNNLSPAAPDMLYAGDYSHGPLVNAQADPNLPSGLDGLIGYCVKVSDPTTVADPAFPLDGFAVEHGTIEDTDASRTHPVGDILTTEGDVYCVVIKAEAPAVNGTSAKVTWHYRDRTTFVQGVTETPLIPIVVVTLKGFDGPVGTVCTVGWFKDADNNIANLSAFATGTTSNPPPLPTDPNPLDDVRRDDWTPLASIPVGSLPFKQGDEWCIDIQAAPGTVAATFTFETVYNLRSRDDDQSHTIGANVTITDVQELRHVTINGQLASAEDANENVVGAMHYACIVPSGAQDVLNANGVQINHGSGDQPNVTNLTVFHDGGAIDFGGVSAGTLCFGWTSTQPGEQLVTATYQKWVVDHFEIRSVNWDTDGDGNGTGAGSRGPLVKEWNRIDRTEITSGGDPRAAGATTLTNKSMTQSISLNVADGRFLSGTIGLSEWVLGSHTGVSGPMTDLALDGVILVARLSGGCGYFVTPETNVDPLSPPLVLPKEISGVSWGGKFALTEVDVNGVPTTIALSSGPTDIQVSIDHDGGCSPGSSIRVAIDAYYPGNPNRLFGTETVDISFTFTTGSTAPIVAWAGQTVSLGYSFSGTCPDDTVHFTRSEGQPGGFVGGKPDSLTLPFVGCSASALYESEMPGEVDIVVFLQNNPYSKVAFTIYFVALEDLTITATPSAGLGQLGNVSAQIRGWFPSKYPSGRLAETKPDGHTVPADRWILPTDAGTLYPNGSVPGLPSTRFTFFMENEPVVNGYKTGIKDGALGWFIPDSSSSSLNVNPRTGEKSALGSELMPRIITQSGAGGASVGASGDFNLSFEGCDKNVHTGNPYCKVGDVVGHTRYHVIADYPEMTGQLPPLGSEVVQTNWTWGGFKQVTIVDTDAPSVKYVVAHVTDRYGVCDAIPPFNVRGVSLKWEIDAGNGSIIEGQGQPAPVDAGRRSAHTTTFDTADTANEAIVKTVVAAGECQAWIKLTNSLLTPTNVRVTFPAPLPLDEEGEIVLDVTVDFGAQVNKLLEAGWNLVTAGRSGSIRSAMSGNEAKVSAIYTWDPVASNWKLFVPGGPAFLSAFDQFEAGRAYWVQVKQPFTLYVPR